MNNLICSICYEIECDVITPCNHCFHRICLERWTEQRPNCPICRQNINEIMNDNDSEIGVDFTLDSDTYSSDDENDNITILNSFANTINHEFRQFDNNMDRIVNNFMNIYNNSEDLNRGNMDEIVEITEENDNLRDENLLLSNEIVFLRRRLRNVDRQNIERNNLTNLRRRILCLENSLNAISNSNTSNLINNLRERIHIIQNDYSHSNYLNNILSNRLLVLENLASLRSNRISRLRGIIDICDNIIILQKNVKEQYQQLLHVRNNEVERLSYENDYYKNYYRVTRSYFNIVMSLINSHNE